MDTENKENVPPPDEGQEASWRDNDDEDSSELYPEPIVTAHELPPTHELSLDLANKCLTFAEESLFELGPYVLQLEMHYQECPTYLTPAHMELFISHLQVIHKRVLVAHRLSVIVDKYRPEPEIRHRTETIRMLTDEHFADMNNFLNSIARDIRETRRRDEEMQAPIRVRRYEEIPPRAQIDHAAAAPLANQPKRARQRQQSSDLRRRREGRGC
ncbi:hypothetical protein GQX73_g7666 [Xylaria multiplex]|uniref:Uncharacterized protein n=1 Tax=Xylaria multiplex TaxID=323545 RepID=A0A7C8MP05_9PEZI|nr:hypothetical protein GQX73_g7666 [Xylaria multiplex]